MKKFSFLVVGFLGPLLFSGETFAYPECNAPDIEVGDYTIAACNVGTTIAGIGEESYGAYFQWGNNFGFPSTGEVTTGDILVANAGTYDSNNPYSSSTFIIPTISNDSLGVGDWASPQNDNLWGGSDDTILTNNLGTDVQRQGPCATGYHIPTVKEWQSVLDTSYTQGIFTATPNGAEYALSDEERDKFVTYFKLPLAGYRNRNANGRVDSASTEFIYRTSSPSTTLSYQLRFLNQTLYMGATTRAYGLSLRCFKNDIRNEVCNRITDIPESECKALVDFYYSTNGDGWTKGFSGDISTNRPWLTESLACNWIGITCNTSPKYVTKIVLANNNLQGVLNPSLFALSGLVDFSLQSNSLTGSLPPSYSTWIHLTMFNVSANKITGTLPSEYSSRTELKTFYVQDNQIGGELPSDYMTLTKLTNFAAMDNKLTGILPEEYGNAWTGIMLFRVHNNHLIGEIPDSYCNWGTEPGVVFSHFSVSNNDLTGTLPDKCIESFKMTRILELGNNHLDLSKIKFEEIPNLFLDLVDFDIGNSNVNGYFSSGWENYPKIRYLDISNNKITGEIPELIGSYPLGVGAAIGLGTRNYALNIRNNCLEIQSIQEPLLSFIAQRAEPDWKTTQTACQVITPPTPAPSYGGGGWGGGSSVVKDVCPNGDFSPSYYDGTCGNKITEDGNQKITEDTIPTTESGIQESSDNLLKESSEILLAYDWAFQHNITTLSPIENANLTGPLLRSHMAKMVVNYAMNVLGTSPEMGITPSSLRDTSPAVLREGKIRNLSMIQEDENEYKNNELPLFLSRSTAGVAEGGGAIAETGCTFSDIANQTQELQTYITLACQLGIMGIHTDGTPLSDFMPNKVVSRAEFGTVLSRILWGDTYNDAKPYYTNHLQVLKNNGIMTQIDNPEQRKEVRQRVRLMLMRSAE